MTTHEQAIATARRHIETFLAHARDKLASADNEHSRAYYSGAVNATEVALTFLLTAAMDATLADSLMDKEDEQ